MKRNSVHAEIVSSLAKLAMISSLASACGGKSFDTPEDSQLRPPATSDPLTASEQRQWEAKTTLGPVRELPPRKSILETKVERETFLQDVTEQTPTHSLEQLTTALEDQFEKNQKELIKDKDKDKDPNPPVVPPNPTEPVKKSDVKPELQGSAASRDWCKEIDVNSEKEE
ncbi:MAG TPA: hypothetical protein VIG33_14280, partial [Pseudobdellovibrionaceae bacterium]